MVKAPEIECTCGQMMKFIDQENLDDANTRIKIRHECTCTNKAVSFLFLKEGIAHVYIKTLKGDLLSHSIKELKGDMIEKEK